MNCFKDLLIPYNQDDETHMTISFIEKLKPSLNSRLLGRTQIEYVQGRRAKNTAQRKERKQLKRSKSAPPV